MDGGREREQGWEREGKRGEGGSEVRREMIILRVRWERKGRQKIEKGKEVNARDDK